MTSDTQAGPRPAKTDVIGLCVYAFLDDAFHTAWQMVEKKSHFRLKFSQLYEIENTERQLQRAMRRAMRNLL